MATCVATRVAALALALLTPAAVTRAQSDADRPADTSASTQPATEAREPLRDPTRPDESLRRLMPRQTEFRGQAQSAAGPAAITVRLQGLVLVEGKPPRAVIRVADRFHLIRPDERMSARLDDGRVVELRVHTIKADQLDITADSPDIKVLIQR